MCLTKHLKYGNTEITRLQFFYTLQTHKYATKITDTH